MPVREHVHVYYLIDKMLITIKNYDLDEVGALEKNEHNSDYKHICFLSINFSYLTQRFVVSIRTTSHIYDIIQTINAFFFDSRGI